MKIVLIKDTIDLARGSEECYSELFNLQVAILFIYEYYNIKTLWIVSSLTMDIFKTIENLPSVVYTIYSFATNLFRYHCLLVRSWVSQRCFLCTSNHYLFQKENT